MKCGQVEKVIPLFVGDDLPEPQAHDVREHLGTCEGCRAEVAQHRESRDWLQRGATLQPSGQTLAELRRSVLRAVDEEQRRPAIMRWADRVAAALRRWASHPGLAASAAALVLVTGAVGLARWGSFQPRRSPVMQPWATVPSPAPQPDELAWDEPDLDAESEGPAARDRMLASANLDEATTAPPTQPRDQLRVEIQTNDKNVRIIMFVPKDRILAVEN